MNPLLSQFRLRLVIFLRLRAPRLFKVIKEGERLILAFRNEFIDGARAISPQHWLRVGAPKGGFSEYDALTDEEKKEQTIVFDQGAPVIPEQSMLVLCRLTQHRQQPFPVFWQKLPNARLIGPSLVRLNSEKQISDVYGKSRFKKDRAYNYLVLPKAICLPGPWTSIVSTWTPSDKPANYAHWLLDALPRLNLLERFPPETRIIVPKTLAPYQKETLEILQVGERCRPTAEGHILIDQYYYSSPASMIVCWSPYSIDFLRTHFLPCAEKSAPFPRRFFLNRRGFRNLANRQEVEEFFLKHGWEVIDTEGFSFREQIALFSQAEAICAIHGAGLANLAWCSPGCKVLEIFPSSYLSGCYEWMAHYCQLSYEFIIYPSDANMNAVVDMVTLELHLKAMKML